MRIELVGTNTARYKGHDVTTQAKRSPLGPLARRLISEGYHSSNMCEVWRGNTIVFNAAPLSHYADFDVTESDSSGLKRKPYVEFEKF